MKKKRIGRTKLEVTDIAFGCASIGNLYRKVEDDEAHEVLDAAWDVGIRYFDTAPHYGRGLSEQRLGRFLSQHRRTDYVISTKVGRVLSRGAPMAAADGFVDPLPNAVRYDYSGDGIEASLEGSLARLGIDHVDIAYVHDIGHYTHGDDHGRHMEAFLGSGYDRLVRLRERGRIGAIGLGVNETAVCLDILRHGALDAILLAGRLTLLDRSAETALLAACRNSGTSLILGGIFNSGILATGATDSATYDYLPASLEIRVRVNQLAEQARALGLSLPAAALHYCHGHPAATSILLGTAKATSLARNMALLAKPPPPSFRNAFS